MNQRQVSGWAAAPDGVRLGVCTGLLAGVPQVLVVQVLERVLKIRGEPADIGPRFVDRLARRAERPQSPWIHWLLAAVFHFGYAAVWGGLYGAIQSRRRLPPTAAGLALTALIYMLAFSRIGVATRLGSEPHPHRRERRRQLIHLTAPLTYSMVLAYGFEWLRASNSTR
ncbi:MAG: hypothetical protein JOZ39_07550 [Chloroflexi bacterium]|nr:hypothetical protein [Chloroflexota bacterium]